MPEAPETLDDKLESLNDELDKLAKTVRDSTKKRQRSDKERKDQNHRSGRSMAFLGKQLAGITLLLTGLTQFVTAIHATNEVQKKAVSINTSLAASLDKTRSTMESMPGGLARANELVVEGLTMGLREVPPSLTRLANQMSLTGQEHVKSFQLFRTLQKQLNFSEESTDRLADIIMRTSDKYNVQTGFLIDALTGVTDSLRPLSVVGADRENVALAISQLAAQVVPGAEPMLQQFVNEVMTMAQDDSRRALAGSVYQTEQLIQAIEQSASPSVIAQALRDSVFGAANVPGSLGNTLTAVGREQQAFNSNLGTLATVLREAFISGPGVTPPGDPYDESKLGSILETHLSNVVDPIKTGLQKAQGAVLQKFSVLTQGLTRMSTTVIRLLEKISDGVTRIADFFTPRGS